MRLAVHPGGGSNDRSVRKRKHAKESTGPKTFGLQNGDADGHTGLTPNTNETNRTRLHHGTRVFIDVRLVTKGHMRTDPANHPRVALRRIHSRPERGHQKRYVSGESVCGVILWSGKNPLMTCVELTTCWDAVQFDSSVRQPG